MGFYFFLVPLWKVDNIYCVMNINSLNVGKEIQERKQARKDPSRQLLVCLINFQAIVRVFKN